VRVKTLEAQDLFRQPIRLDISYEQHLGAKLLAGVPQAPEPVRLSGVFSYPRHAPAAIGGAESQHRPLDVGQAVVKVRPRSAPDAATGRVAGGPLRTADEDLVATHVLDSMAAQGVEVFGDKWPKVRAELAEHVKTLAIQRGLGQYSRGDTSTIALKSVSGGRVVLGAHVDSMNRADSTATTEFYRGGETIQKTSFSTTNANSVHGYVQPRVNVLPMLSALGRFEGGIGTEAVHTDGHDMLTGLIFRNKGPSLTHVGVATVEADMSRPRGILGLSGKRISRVGAAQVDFTTRQSATDAQDHQQHVPRDGIIHKDQNPHDDWSDSRGTGVPVRGLSRDSIVGRITDGEQFRARTLENLREHLSWLTKSRISFDQVSKALSDTQLEHTLAAMTRGEKVELLRSGSLRITGRADVSDLSSTTNQHPRGDINLLREVNQIQLDEPAQTQELGARLLLGPHLQLPGFLVRVEVGGGGIVHRRGGRSFSQTATVSASSKFTRPYAAFDGTTRITLTVHDGDTEHVLPGVDLHGPILIPQSETHPVETASAPTESGPATNMGESATHPTDAEQSVDAPGRGAISGGEGARSNDGLVDFWSDVSSDVSDGEREPSDFLELEESDSESTAAAPSELDASSEVARSRPSSEGDLDGSSGGGGAHSGSGGPDPGSVDDEVRSDGGVRRTAPTAKSSVLPSRGASLSAGLLAHAALSAHPAGLPIAQTTDTTAPGVDD
jgi:hypothetical protein